MSRLIDLESKETDIMISEIRDRFGDFVAVKVKELLEELPEAQRWIPVTERLPEKKDFVIVTVNDGAIYTTMCMYDGRFVGYDGDVTAWKPLPEPYKENDHEID